MGRSDHCGNCVATNRLTSDTSMSTLLASEEPVHDVQTDAAEGWMGKGLRNGANYVKSQLLPELHGDVVGCHDRVELHRGVPLLLCAGECVLAKRPSNSPPPRI